MRLLWRAALLGFLLACTARPGVPAHRDFYVDPSGDDDADGRSPARAWRTIDRVNRHDCEPGDRIRFRGGARFEGNLHFDEADRGAAGAPVAIGSFGRGRATIAAGDGTGVLVENAGHFVVRDLIVEGRDRAANRGSGVRFVNRLPDAARLESVAIEGVEAHGFREAGIHVGGDPADKSQSGYRGVRIENCVAYDNAYYGIFVTGVWDQRATRYANADVLIARSVAHHNPGDPAFLANHSGSGIYLDNVDGGRIEHCLAYENGALCRSNVGGPVGIWAHAANRVVIAHCVSHHNRTGGRFDGGGFDFDGGVSNSVMRDNRSYENDGPGFMLYTYRYAPHRFFGNLVRDNRSENDARRNRYGALHIVNDGNGVDDLRIEGNTIRTGPSARGGEPRAVLIARVGRVALRRNRFFAAGGVPLADLAKEQPGVRFAENRYAASPGRFLIEDAGRRFGSLAEWRQATGHEMARGVRER